MSEGIDFEQRIVEGLKLPDERKFYFNGYTVSITPQDVIIILQKNNQPFAVLNTSHSIAKTFVEALSKLIEDFEKRTNHEILTLSDYEERLKDAEAK